MLKTQINIRRVRQIIHRLLFFLFIPETHLPVDTVNELTHSLLPYSIFLMLRSISAILSQVNRYLLYNNSSVHKRVKLGIGRKVNTVFVMF